MADLLPADSLLDQQSGGTDPAQTSSEPRADEQSVSRSPCCTAIDASKLLSQAEFQELELALHSHIASLRWLKQRGYANPGQQEQIEGRLRICHRLCQAFSISCTTRDLAELMAVTANPVS